MSAAFTNFTNWHLKIHFLWTTFYDRRKLFYPFSSALTTGMSKYCLNHLLTKLIMALPIYCDESLRMRASHLLRFLSHMRRKTPLLKPEAVDLEDIKRWETPCWPGTQQCLPQTSRNATTHHGFARDASATNQKFHFDVNFMWARCFSIYR